MGKAPTYRAIQREMPKAFSSTAKIRGYLQVLKNRGKIETTHRGSILADERLCCAFSDPKPQLLLTKPKLNVPKPDKMLAQLCPIIMNEYETICKRNSDQFNR